MFGNSTITQLYAFVKPFCQKKSNKRTKKTVIQRQPPFSYSRSLTPRRFYLTLIFFLATYEV